MNCTSCQTEISEVQNCWSKGDDIEATRDRGMGALSEALQGSPAKGEEI